MTNKSGSVLAAIILTFFFCSWSGLTNQVMAAAMTRQSGHSKLKKAILKQPRKKGLKKIEVATQVKSVSPSKLILTPGTKGKTITVNGLALTRVTGVKLLQNKRSVSGVSASIKGSVKADSFKVSLSIASNAKPGNYQLHLLAGKKTIHIASSQFTAQVAALSRAMVSIAGAKPTLVTSPPSGLKAGLKDLSPSVQSVSPYKTNLVGDAAPTTIALKGRNLNRITSVQVLRGNSPVSTVKASLRKGRKGGSRQLTLSATKSALPGNYQLRLFIVGGPPITLSSKLLFIRVLPSSLAQIKGKDTPMLSKAKVKLVRKGGPQRLEKMDLEKKGKGGGNPVVPTTEELKKESSQITGGPGMLGGIFEQAQVSDEEVSQWSLKSQLPDIIVVDLEQENNILKARLKMLNNPAGEQRTFDLKFDIYIGGQPNGRTNGQSITFVGSDPVWVGVVALGIYSDWETIKIHVNPDKTVIESDYDNNTKSEALSFEGNIFPGLPDFYVDKVYIGSDKKVRVRIGNIGQDYSGPLNLLLARTDGKYKKIQTINVSINQGGVYNAIIDLAGLSARHQGDVNYIFTATVNPEGPGRIEEVYDHNNSGRGYISAKLLFSLSDFSLVQVKYVEQGIILGETQLISVELYKSYSLRLTLKNMGDGLPTSDISFRRKCNGHTDALSKYSPNHFQTQDYIGTGQNSYRSTGWPYYTSPIGTPVQCEIILEHLNESVSIFTYSERGYQ